MPFFLQAKKGAIKSTTLHRSHFQPKCSNTDPNLGYCFVPIRNVKVFNGLVMIAYVSVCVGVQSVKVVECGYDLQ